jgi:FKBP-type peptidyl-prolyl cis-trans isomerase SlyD
MRVAKNKVIYFTYIIVDEQGEVFEQSDVPMAYLHGSDNGLYLKVEAALEGCDPGQQVEVVLSPDESFGWPDEAMIVTEDLQNAPPQFRHVGARAQFENQNGEVREFIVTRIENGRMTLDGNHPLAGQNVTFRVTVVDVRDASPEELREGEPAGAGATHLLH